MNKKSKIFIIIFFSLILIPVIVIGIINYTKEQELNNRIENNRNTKTLSVAQAVWAFRLLVKVIS